MGDVGGWLAKLERSEMLRRQAEAKAEQILGLWLEAKRRAYAAYEQSRSFRAQRDEAVAKLNAELSRAEAREAALKEHLARAEAAVARLRNALDILDAKHDCGLVGDADACGECAACSLAASEAREAELRGEVERLRTAARDWKDEAEKRWTRLAASEVAREKAERRVSELAEAVIVEHERHEETRRERDEARVGWKRANANSERRGKERDAAEAQGAALLDTVGRLTEALEGAAKWCDEMADCWPEDEGRRSAYALAANAIRLRAKVALATVAPTPEPPGVAGEPQPDRLDALFADVREKTEVLAERMDAAGEPPAAEPPVATDLPSDSDSSNYTP